MRHYERENGRHARLYDGVREGIDAMRALGLRLACVTNKPQRLAEAVLAQFDLHHDFALALGGDALARRKPDPLPMRHAAAVLGVPPARCLAIGDSVNDVLAARAAGMPVLVVPYGYNEGRDVRGLDVDGIVGSLAEAAGLVRRRRAG
jgi:phosphoglycolate phosphatase